MGRATARHRGTVLRWHDGAVVSRSTVDSLAGEEPLEVRIGDEVFVVTMRTPGHDVELVHGLLLAEGVIYAAGDVRSAVFCAPDKGPVGLPGADPGAFTTNTYNTLSVVLAPEAKERADRRRRATVTSSACGSCGAQAAESYLSPSVFPPVVHAQMVSAPTLLGLTDQLAEHQKGFSRSGGMHAAMLVAADGGVLVAREDIGRHNAVDKVLGWALTNNAVPARDKVLVVSSRVSYEIVAKASMAGVGVVVGVSAASTLAVEVGQARGVTVVGFARGDRATVYTHPERVGEE